ncbi:glycoside hydrolase family 3 C-terminal domain-containing protein [Pedobacter glucosidilyticus]|uniref:glycoside hydrolase family 3 C-terminal domain-containing protein n=1 Tax=Pedobacter glucosidilyticus TaxID=1122941 RepID=UPI00040D66D0|nr:glycoside hydrolase family 3 C-terminal domain-containing protein [Pedobacter glucosidilyticus]
MTIRILTLSLTFLFSICGYSQAQIYLDNSQPIETRVKDALSRMTLEEKVKLTTAQSKFSSHGVPRLGIPEIWMSDGPHGVRMEILWDSWNHAKWTNDSCTAFPALTCLAATWDPSVSYLYGNAIGEEARYRRKDVLLGPGVNIYRTPLNGRNFEYMGEDPYLASKMVVPYIQGVQRNGVAACVKHFALNNQEKWRNHINVEVSDRALNEIYLPAFKAAVQEGKVWTIMGAYNQVRGEYACHNDLLLNKILKKDWGFDGTVISDWGGTHNTREAALNGLDIEMGTYTNGFTSNVSAAYDNYYLASPYLKMLKAGEIPLSNIDDKASRILRLIFRTAMAQNKPFGSLANDEHHSVARKVGEEGIVLLKNSAGLLPLNAAKYKKIVIVGENATRKLTEGGGSSELKVKKEVSPLEGISNKFGKAKITYTMGYASGDVAYDKVLPPKYNTDSLRTVAIKLAQEADLVIYVGGLNKNSQQDSEGDDRKSYELPFDQNQLISGLQQVNKNIVMVMLSGNAYEMPWLNKATTLIQAWYLGSESGNAIANILSGDVNPSGKLPFSFPVKLTDNSAHAFGEISYPGDSTNQYYKDDILVGYRWYDTKKIASQYPFGFGLSYSKFLYGKAKIDKTSIKDNDVLTVTVPVKNTSNIAGKEVIQLYIHDKKSSELRPEKELKAFQKVELLPGEEKIISFKIDKSSLKFYSDNKKQWVAEAGKFSALIGSSSRDIKSSLDFILE